MKSIRRGTFETNSSSSHSITIASKKDYDKWSDDEAFLFGDEIIPYSEVYIFVKKWIKETIEKYEDYKKEDANPYYWDKRINKWKDYLSVVDDYDAKTFTEKFKYFVVNDVIEKDNLAELFQEMRDADSIYSYGTYYDYYGNEYEMYEEEKNIDGVDVIAFGYYGYN